MDAVFTRTGEAPPTRAPRQRARRVRRALGRLLLPMAQTTAERLISPQRDPSPEWFRHPLP